MVGLFQEVLLLYSHWLEELTHQQLAEGWDGLDIVRRLPWLCSSTRPLHITGLASSQHGGPVVHFLTKYLAFTGKRQKMPIFFRPGLKSLSLPLAPYSISQSKSQSQSRFKEKENRLDFLLG